MGGGGSGGSSSGTFGSRTLGSSTSAGQRTMAQGMSGSGLGTGQNSQSGLGTTAGQLNSSDQFLRSNRTGANDFVGTTAQQMQKDFTGAVQAGQTNTGSRNGTTGLGGTRGLNGLTGMSGNRTTQQSGQFNQAANQNQTQIRSVLRVDIPVTRPDPNHVTAALVQRLTQVPSLHFQGPVQVDLVGTTAVLRGTVATQHDRDLAAQLVRLEPGVGQVQNEIVVAGSGNSPAATRGRRRWTRWKNPRRHRRLDRNPGCRPRRSGRCWSLDRSGRGRYRGLRYRPCRVQHRPHCQFQRDRDRGRRHTTACQRVERSPFACGVPSSAPHRKLAGRAGRRLRAARCRRQCRRLPAPWGPCDGLPGRISRTGSPTTTEPSFWLEAGDQADLFWGPPTSSHGSQKL